MAEGTVQDPAAQAALFALNDLQDYVDEESTEHLAGQARPWPSTPRRSPAASRCGATISFTEQPGLANTSLKTKGRPAGTPGASLSRMASSPSLVRRRPSSTSSIAYALHVRATSLVPPGPGLVPMYRSASSLWCSNRR